MKSLWLILIPLLMLILAACTDGPTRRALDRAGARLDSAPDSALLILDSIHPSRRSDRARHALYTLVADSKLTGNVDNDSLISLIRPLADDNTPSRDAMIARMYLGVGAMQGTDHRTAIHWLIKAERHAISLTDSLYLSRIYSHLSYLYHNDYNSHNELRYARLAVLSSPLEDSLSRPGDYLRLGQSYYRADSLPQALEALYQSITYSRRYVMPDIESDALATGAAVYAKLNQQDEALTLYRAAASIGLTDPKLYFSYALTLYQNGYVDEADSIISLLEPQIGDDPETRFSYLSYVLHVARTKGDYRLALEVCDSLEALSTPLLDHQLDYSVAEAESEYYSLCLADTRQLYEAQRKASRMSVVVGVLMVIVSLLVIYILIARFRNASRENAILITSLRSELTSALSAAESAEIEYSNTLHNLSHDLTRSQDEYIRVRDALTFATRLSGLVGDALDTVMKACEPTDGKKQDAVSSAAAIKRKMQDLNYSLFSAKGKSLAYTYLNLKHEGVIDSLQHDFPDLDDKDLRLLALFMLGFSNAAIASLTHTTYNAVAQRKSRLKKKILDNNSSSYKEIYRFIFY